MKRYLALTGVVGGVAVVSTGCSLSDVSLILQIIQLLSGLL